MNGLVLLVLSLMTAAGCGTSRYLVGCRRGWLEFKCNYPRGTKRYEGIKIENNRNIFKQPNKWLTAGQFFLFLDPNKRQLRVSIKSLWPKPRELEFSFLPSGEEREVKVSGAEHCLETYQTVKRTEKTTITCNYQDQPIKSNVKFFCRENRFTCESILSTNRKSNGSFSLRETPGGFQVSISGVSANDAGVYWCAVKGRDYQRGVQKITLQVKEPPTTSVPTVIPSVTSANTSAPTSAWTHPAPTSPQDDGGSWLPGITVAVVCVAVLVLVLIVLLYNRRRHLKSQNKAEQSNKEEAIYEETREHPLQPASGTAIKTIYATAGFPTSPSGISHKPSDARLEDSDQQMTYATLSQVYDTVQEH